MLDHYYDKLLHLATPLLESGNEFFVAATHAGLDAVRALCETDSDGVQACLDWADKDFKGMPCANVAVLAPEVLALILEGAHASIEAASGRSVLHISYAHRGLESGDGKGRPYRILDTSIPARTRRSTAPG